MTNIKFWQYWTWTWTVVQVIKTCVSLREIISLFFNLWSHFKSRTCFLNDWMFNKTITNTLLFGSWTSSTINGRSKRIQLYSTMVYGFAFMAAALKDPMICKSSKDVTLLNAAYIYTWLKFLGRCKSKPTFSFGRLNPCTLWTVHAQANIIGNNVLLITT